MCDQKENSPHNINTLASKTLLRRKKNIRINTSIWATAHLPLPYCNPTTVYWQQVRVNVGLRERWAVAQMLILIQIPNRGHHLISHQTLKAESMRAVGQKVRRIYVYILGVKGLIFRNYLIAPLSLNLRGVSISIKLLLWLAEQILFVLPQN